jgi:methylsterol monooxygenase
MFPAARNATQRIVPSGSYWEEYGRLGKQNVQLNMFERLWAAWYAYMQNDVLATCIMSFVMHEVFYFGRALPWFIIDAIPYFRKYKIQAVRWSSPCSYQWEQD